jgi:hypothetical protein
MLTEEQPSLDWSDAARIERSLDGSPRTHFSAVGTDLLRSLDLDFVG